MGSVFFVMHAFQLHVCLLHLHYTCLFHLVDVDHDGSKVVMRNLMIDFVECILVSIQVVSYDYMSLIC